MNTNSNVSMFDISSSGLSAERARMDVIANNIANANATRDKNGNPYQRQEVVFATSYQDALQGHQEMAGVEVVGIQPDQSEFPMIYQPGHPDADDDGYVKMPNVNLANEMVDLITASRGYEANLRVLRSFRDMANSAIELLRGI